MGDYGEPWLARSHKLETWIFDTSARYRGIMLDYESANRAARAVNACEKEPDSHLKPGIVRRMREVLEFYANPFTYEQIDFLGECPLSDDLESLGGHLEPGKRARELLAELEESDDR